MPVNIASLHAKLLNISRAKRIDLQLLINRLASEQFLYRLSLSPYAEKFIFKGGSLLTYLIESDRKTKDLDFSIKQMKIQVEYTQLQTYWEHFLKREKMNEAPARIGEIIEKVNAFLKKLYG